MANLILPGTLEFNLALADIPPVPTWRESFDRANGEGYLICRAGSLGLMESVTRQEWEDYVYGGELDARQAEIDEHDEALEGVIY
ncbi:hypothetical protein [Nodosilinea sp. E11]|uniref:hypothetical protein n=1 Tax=Nodosilinea sp. E11 TaxID=3037479 RepID=UPI00293439CE|nr:hypothetical protein [Nodosilinea sp. E11]WOD37372.1 hypothetical protein RRF56_02645 [Nodosilinea sp. E11]WOD37934.1 hypothetical protein RRF56_17110 [Nodosilinea sp. E11]